MKILLTGGGSGGHFYPIIAVAQAINHAARESKLLDIQLYYMAPQPYDERLLFENHITFVRCTAGKRRRYFSILNLIDLFKIAWGTIGAIITVYRIYPDVVFGKGGYVSFPALFAARLFRIPVVIHESDSSPGRVNLWAGKFADRVAISYPQAADYFPKDKVAYTGNPVRNEIRHAVHEGAHEFLQLDKNIPLVLVLGGSQGSQTINQAIIDTLPQLVEKYQVIHQVGKENVTFAKTMAAVVLEKSAHKERYKLFDYLNGLALRMAGGAADVIISRAGASAIAEIALWGTPAILIPITDSNGDHQRKNAYSYARAGAGIFIEEANLTPHILYAEIDRLMGSIKDRVEMRKAAQAFARADAADLIAKEIISIASTHEQ